MKIMNAKRTLTFKNLKKHHIHSSYEKSIIERTIHYIKDETESVDDYFLLSMSKIIFSFPSNNT
jgi:hypothetical protein